jgi:hypothetical protein
MTDAIPMHLAHLSAEELKRVRSIAKLNDAFRRAGPVDGRGQWVLTANVVDKPALTKAKAITRVMTYNAFTEDNDPHGEHDFGAFRIDGERYFWKIDYYDPSLEYGSDDPADPEKTKRVLTLMLASDY